ncbi:cupin domain-containing protein [Kribbella antibiotica]|uniref:Cupin domain-containing protein n=1 Tax=Kribbella antibiotica TaxID=190195 RepID=A0A4V2YPC3_9ACTN|nr:cupin domain-containing protein [Kribbella antibiotica]TDD57677.1 cupin domain-containing protein [Kribbella antibiotica]
MTNFPHSAGTARPYVWAPDQSPAYWNVGTYWRVLADGSQTDGRSCTFEELCPQGLVAPPHVHDKEEEAFFILEGDFVFTVGDEEIPAGPGSYIYLPPKVRHGFRVESEVGRVYNMLTPAGFEQNIITNGQPAPQVSMPPPGTSAVPLWRQLRTSRPPAPWDDPAWAPDSSL